MNNSLIYLIAILFVAISYDLMSEINEENILNDLKSIKLNSTEINSDSGWDLISTIQNTRIKIISRKKIKNETYIRIAFKSYDTVKTINSNNTISTAVGFFDIIYKKDKFDRIFMNWADHWTYFNIDNSYPADSSTINEFKEQEKFWNEFNNAVNKNNKEKLLSMIHYPFSATILGIEIHNNDEFIKHYDKIFTKKIKQYLRNGLLSFPYKHYGTVGKELQESDPLKEGDITLINNSYDISSKKGLAVGLLFRKIDGKYKFVGFYEYY